jgi:antiphage defense system Thoeris ThsB-like protein
MTALVMLHGQSSATQVWKKSDPGLKSSLRRPILDSLFWKTKKRIKNQPAAFGPEVTVRRSVFRWWFAMRDMQGGLHFFRACLPRDQTAHKRIEQAIRVHERVLLILSAHSMNSEWVKTEIAKGKAETRN